MENNREEPNSPMLSRKQAAEYLGVVIGTLTNWTYKKRHNLKVYKVGRSVKYRLEDLDAFILQRYVNKYVNKKEKVMPLVEGKAAKSRKGFGENVKREIEAGKPQKQAVAIAYSKARGKKKTKRKMK